ncbi:EPSP synthase-domain-containing protein [Melampsora americana]|nr:EPSP synthase-domain-containing protein [Melampsora americana]
MAGISSMGHQDIQSVHILGSPSIKLGFRLQSYIAHTVLNELPASTYVIITDTHLAKLHLLALQDAFEKEKPTARLLVYTIPPGEQSKSRETKSEIEDWLLEQRCTRDTVLLALGGGVVGDLIGFVAATFMRGLRFCQIPTTLLAMVDSSVGGKTAIDTPLGKNLIGAFWQPSFVFIDPAYLETLPEREFVNGMAEVIKTAAIWDEKEFEKLEGGVAAIRSAVLSPPTPSETNGITASQQLLLSVIQASVAVKAEVVTKDEKETGLRNLVNFGHTVGHAIEAVLTPDLLHGECVSVGMVLEAEISRALGFLRNDAVGRLSKCLTAYGLPVSLADPRISSAPNSSGLTPDRLLDLMSVDKKNAGKLKKVVLLSRIGRTVEERATGVEDSLIKRIIAPCVRVFPGPPSSTLLKITTPGSKSISNRALVLAALSTGTCRLTNLLSSDDTQVMMTALEDMGGASFSWEDGGATLVVRGGGGKLHPPPKGKQVYLGNAGTAARFLTTVCTLITCDDQPGSTSRSERTVITGNARMKQRPIGPLVDALRQGGNELTYLGSEGCLPLEIPGGGLQGGSIELAASVSSQYVSSILLAAPYARNPVTLTLVGGTVISQPYIDMTLAMMAAFGISVQRDEANQHTYHIPIGKYTCPSGSYAIESDASSATYPLAIAALNGLTITLDNIGSGSLQGDAQFATKVLGPMGCTVEQTATTTKLVGPSTPGKLRQLGTIDMETMTDAFLTACVVLGVAGPGADGCQSTKVVGIANQRVKECDRIAAMVAELAKLGIRAEELPDGIEVYGKPACQILEGARIHCYDDHRVAMAFSVLGSVPGGKGLVLNEKRCVEKTWPSWWDDFSSKMGFVIEGVGEPSEEEKKSQAAKVNENNQPSILLCGMRGSGKSFAGRVAASSLGWPLIDSDLYFQDRHSSIITDFVHKHGWEAFRREEVASVIEILNKFPTRHVISLGGGIVETKEGRELLKSHKGPVVQINRDVEEIKAYLHEDNSRPSLGEPIDVIWKRREPWLLECSDAEFFNLGSTTDSPQTLANEQSVMRQFFDFITGDDKNHVSLRPDSRTYFVALTLASLTEPAATHLPALSNFDQLTTGCDAVELRVDLLSSGGKTTQPPTAPSLHFVRRQIAALRRLTNLPIIFTVRTDGQGGKFPGQGSEKEYFELLELGLRTGCEYVDVELGHSPELIRQLRAKKGNSLLIGSYHDFAGKLSWNSKEMESKYQAIRKYADIVKLVTVAKSIDDNLALLNFRATHSSPSFPPLITINMGLEGQMSRILSPVLSPLTHELLPEPAAPGQLTYNQIQVALDLLGQHPPRQFWLFGNPISHSRSPLMHNTSFEALGLRSHVYSPMETDTLNSDKVKAVLRAPEFGGASVTIPLKLEVLSLMDELTDEAREVGAVNTIIRKGDKLIGDNTDWYAIATLIRRSLPADPSVRSTAVVIGAGGTSRAAVYALHRLGVHQIGLFNRTKSRAEELIATMPTSWSIKLIESFEEAIELNPGIVISTVPSDTIKIPKELLKRKEGGVMVELAYENHSGYEESLGEGWRFVNGFEVLVEQGLKQFEIWTGKKMPIKKVWEMIKKERK